MVDPKHWAKMDVVGGFYYDADLVADPDVQKIMLKAQGNLTKEGYWRDIAIDLANLVDTLKEDRGLIPYLVNALIGMVQQHCYEAGLVHDMGLSANQEAIDLLERLGYLRQVEGGYRFRDGQVAKEEA